MKKKERTAAEYTHIVHPIPPLYCSTSRILILGSLPSVRSREGMFFYHHPQNRFWKVLAALCGEPVPQTIEEKRVLVLEHGFALWDVIRECDIVGSSDASIRNVIPNDISKILAGSSVRRILANGEKAYRMYEQYCCPVTGIHAVRCPSTSPANASFSLEKLAEAWQKAAKEELVSD